MKTAKKLLSLALALVMMFSTLAIFGTVEASALSGVGTNTEFRLEKANHTFGCDISTYNVLGASVLDYSRVDFAKMKADGCDFVILRLGLNHSSNHACQIDKAFLEYYKRARAAGMKLGVYFYSRARTAAEATTEANFVIKTIEDNNMYFEYPIYYDVESEEQIGGTNPSGKTYTALSQSALETVCTTFMTKLEDAGYYPAMYVMKSLYTKFSASFKAKYDFWGAHVKNGEGTAQSALKPEDPYKDYVDSNGKVIDYSNDWGMWQYSWFGHKKFDGYKYDSQYQQLDVNLCYKDYPALMEKYGYNNCKTSAPTTNGSLVAGKTPAFTGSVTLKGTGLTDGVYSTNLEDGTWLALNDTNRFSGDFVNIDYDLGAKYTLTDAKFHFGIHKEYGIGRPYAITVQVSDDKSSWIDIGTVTEVPSGEWADGCYTYGVNNLNGAGRYVRFKMMNSGWLYINEIVLNGTSYTAPSTPPEGENNLILNNKNHTISGSYPDAERKGAGLTDGTLSTNINDGTWLALNDSNAVGGYVNIDYDLGEKYQLKDAKIHLAIDSSIGIGRPYDIQLMASDDGNNWTMVGLFDIPTGAWADGCYTFNAPDTKGAGRYVRITMMNSGWLYINELAVYGEAYIPPAPPTQEANNSLVVGKTPTFTGSVTLKGTGLADGMYSHDFEDGTWLALNDKNDLGVGEYNTCVNIDYDLGAKYDLTDAKLYLGVNKEYGIGRPYGVAVWVSDDNVNWTKAGDFSTEPGEWADGFYTLEANSLNGTGRYVRFLMLNSGWLYVNEIVLNGTEHVDAPSDEPVLPSYMLGDVDADNDVDADDYILLKRLYFGQAKIANLTKPETAELRSDVNVDGTIDADDYILLKRVYFGQAKL